MNIKPSANSSLVSKEVTRGRAEYVGPSTFIGYTCAVETLEDANLAYATVCNKENQARHVACAVRLPGTNFHILDDYNDNDEHGMGRLLQSILRESQMEHRTLFVARHYDEHVGPARFKAIKSTATYALTIGSFNKITGKHQFPWSSYPKREHGNIRGGQHASFKTPVPHLELAEEI